MAEQTPTEAHEADLAEADDNAAALRREIDTLTAIIGRVRAACKDWDLLHAGPAIAVIPIPAIRAALGPDHGRNDGDDCPNCITPWKCNGPHIGREIRL